MSQSVVTRLRGGGWCLYCPFTYRRNCFLSNIVRAQMKSGEQCQAIMDLFFILPKTSLMNIMKTRLCAPMLENTCTSVFYILENGSIFFIFEIQQYSSSNKIHLYLSPYKIHLYWSSFKIHHILPLKYINILPLWNFLVFFIQQNTSIFFILLYNIHLYS